MSSNEGSDSSDSEQNSSQGIDELGNNNTRDKALLETSREKYVATYNKFVDWKKNKQIESLSEDVVLLFFKEMSQKMKPSTLWCHYSMLKNTLQLNDNVNIGRYRKLNTLLRRLSYGYRGKKSKVLTADQVEKFLNEAPDGKYLPTKVALILGIIGACRKQEFCNLIMDDVKDYGSMVLINIRREENNMQRSFTVDGEYCSIIKKYIALRPKGVRNNRFFLSYRNGKCTSQAIGVNTFGAMPRRIAAFLNLPNPEAFTGRSFRMTSASLLAAGYIRTTIQRKRKISEQVGEYASSNPSASNENSEFEVSSTKRCKTGNNVNLGASTSTYCNLSLNDKIVESPVEIIDPNSPNNVFEVGVKAETEDYDSDPLQDDFGIGMEESWASNASTSSSGCCVNLWSSESTKCLIALYKKYINMVGRPHMRSMKEMFEKISADLKAQGHDYSTQKVENKWRVLERKYKKHEAVKEKIIGRIPGKFRRSLYFEHKEELDEIFGPISGNQSVQSADNEANKGTAKATKNDESTTNSTSHSEDKTSDDVNTKMIEDLVDKIAVRLESCFKNIENNNERRHQEYSAIKLNELEIQRQMLEIRKQELEFKKKQMKLSKNSDLTTNEESILS